MGVSLLKFPQISNKMANPVSKKGIYDIRCNLLKKYFTISENLLILDDRATPVPIEEAENAR